MDFLLRFLATLFKAFAKAPATPLAPAPATPTPAPARKPVEATKRPLLPSAAPAPAPEAETKLFKTV